MNDPLVVRDFPGPHGYEHKPHHRRGRFVSPSGGHVARHRGRAIFPVLRELALRGNEPVHFPPQAAFTREQALEGLTRHTVRDENALALTWLGQSAFYFRLEGMGILTDPFLGARASPVSFSGPKRLAPSPLGIGDLDVQVLVISHNHYDHLCAETLKRLPGKKDIRVVVPLGLGRLIRRLGFQHVAELDWYQQALYRTLCITALPAYHFSGRSLLDADRSLWASMAIEGQREKIFFAGDTGYGKEFTRIGDLLGPFDVALVPIGAYAPRDVFAAVHASPEEAVRMGEDVKAAQLVGMHWGTLRLTTEPFWEPRERFLREKNDLPRSVLAIGETRLIPTSKKES